MKKAAISRRAFQKAFRRVLGINYQCRVLEMRIRPSSVEWWLAVSELNDKDRKWQPKIIIFNDYDQTCGLWNGILDKNPAIVNASTMLSLAVDVDGKNVL